MAEMVQRCLQDFLIRYINWCVSSSSFELDVLLYSVFVTQKLLWLHAFRQAEPPQRVDCLAPKWETALSVFPKRRLAAAIDVRRLNAIKV